MNYHYLIPALLLMWAPALLAEALEFSPPLIVTSTRHEANSTTGNKQFIHLESSGRRLIAVSGSTVAVAWEDNRSGQPAIYVAYLSPEAKQFTAARRVSAESPAYEPVITALADNRFLIGWEQDDRAWLRIISPKDDGSTLSLTDAPSRQVSVASMDDNRAAAVWAEKGNKNTAHYHIQFAELRINQINIEKPQPITVDSSKNRRDQLYPVLELTHQGSTVVWEDRRQGATRMFYAFAPRHGEFAPYRPLNEFAPPPNFKFGRGTGAMRAALASDHKSLVAAAWMDKREWRGGYDVYADVSHDGGKTFGKNEKAQDMFGNDIPQWHASISLRKQDKIIATAWDDTRNDNPDVFYSLRVNGEWSDDYELPGASGAAAQSHPAIVFDDQGILHAVWLETSSQGIDLKYSHSQ